MIIRAISQNAIKGKIHIRMELINLKGNSNKPRLKGLSQHLHILPLTIQIYLTQKYSEYHIIHFHR